MASASRAFMDMCGTRCHEALRELATGERGVHLASLLHAEERHASNNNYNAADDYTVGTGTAAAGIDPDPDPDPNPNPNSCMQTKPAGSSTCCSAAR